MKAATACLLLCLLVPAGCGGSEGEEGNSASASADGKSGTAASEQSTPASAAAEVMRGGTANVERSSVPPDSEPQLTFPGGPPPKRLVVHDLIEGTGKTAKRGDIVVLEYIGMDYTGGEFTNSWERSKPFAYELGSNSLFANPGWERGIPGMQVGGRRKLIIPPDVLNYAPPTNPDDTAIYLIDLVAVQ